MNKYTMVIALLSLLVLAGGSAPVSSLQGEAEEFRKAMNDPRSKKKVVFLVQMHLGRMGYGTGPFDGQLKPRDLLAIESFRKAARIPTTGELDYATFKAIDEAYKKTEAPHVMTSRQRVTTSMWGEYVSAKGTWIIEGQEQGIPIQTTELQCYKALGQCIEATAMLQDGDYLAVWLETHEVDRWDDFEIITKRDLACVRYTIRISKVQKTVTGLRAKIDNTEACKQVGSADLRLRMADGIEALKGYKSKRREAILTFYRADWSVLDDDSTQK